MLSSPSVILRTPSLVALTELSRFILNELELDIIDPKIFISCSLKVELFGSI